MNKRNTNGNIRTTRDYLNSLPAHSVRGGIPSTVSNHKHSSEGVSAKAKAEDVKRAGIKVAVQRFRRFIVYCLSIVKSSITKLSTRQAFAGFGVLIILTSVIGGLPLARWLTAKNYQLNQETLDVIGRASPVLAKKLVYNSEEKMYQFNPENKKPELSSNNPAEVAAQLQKTAVVGEDTNKGLYSLDISEDPKKGTTIYDNNVGLSFTMVPLFELMPGRKQQDRLIYPAKDGVKAIYTVKSNGLKEDIVFQTSPKSGEASFDYELKLPDSLEARLLDDGSLGIYSADPVLFGNMTFGSDEDQEKVMSARQNAEKNNLVFSLPRPVIVAANGDTGDSYAWFSLKGSVLTIQAKELDTIEGSFSIDPTVVITSTSDFATGNNEYGVDFEANEIRRDTISGGSVGNWTGTSSFNTPRYSHSSVAYNQFIYVIGGARGGYLNSVQYASVNSNGTVGTWSAATNLTYGTRDHASVVYNGRLYVIGGLIDNGGPTYSNYVEYAQINSDGSLGTWTATTSFPNARYNHTSVAYNGYLYILGGTNDSTRYDSVYFASINTNGSIGSWTATTSLPIGKTGHSSVVYNDYLYIIAGMSNSGSTKTVEYAYIKSDGTLGSWQSTTSLSNNKDESVGIASNGYLYVIGGEGASGIVEFAPLYSNGKVGEWSYATSYSPGRYQLASVASNGYIYVLGGLGGGGNPISDSLNDVQYSKISSPGILSEFEAESSLTSERYDHASIAYNGYLYLLGGASWGSPGANVQYAAINADGTLGSWVGTNGFNIARTAHRAAVYNGYIYVSGGNSSGGYQNTVEYAKINSNGSLGTWTLSGSTYPNGRTAHGTVAYNGYLYVLGGYDGGGVGSVYYAPINSSNGSIGSWSATTGLTYAQNWHGTVVYGGRIYILGGYGSSGHDVVMYNTINSNGTLGASWTETTPLPTGLTWHSATVVNGYIFVLGGDPGSGVISDIYSAQINSDSSVGDWSLVGNLFSDRGGHTAVGYNGHIYVLGGYDGSGNVNTAEFAKVKAGGSGTLGSWATTNNTSFIDRAEHTTVVYNGYIYVIGGDGGGFLSSVQYAQINDDGTLSNWSSTTSFNSNRIGHSTVAYNGYMYILAGDAGSYFSDVQYAPINSNGTLGSWQYTQNLPINMSWHSSIAYNGYIYTIGGRNNYTSYISTVYYAHINSNGTIGSWSTTTSLPFARSNHDTVVYNGYVYALGGETQTQEYNAVTFAAINPNGTLGGWTYTTNLNLFMSNIEAVAYNGFMYVLGGYTGVGNLDVVHYSPISANGTLGDWQATTELSFSRWGHTAEVHNGYIYTLGGNSGSGPLDTVEYAPLNIISRSGRYSKLIDFGSEVDVSNFDFSGDLAAAGDEFELRAAGNDGILGTPFTPNILGGTCQTSVVGRYVLITVNMDDSLRATQPDASSNSSSIQDLTISAILGSPPPELRLRGGKFFLGNILQPLDTRKVAVCA